MCIVYRLHEYIYVLCTRNYLTVRALIYNSINYKFSACGFLTLRPRPNRLLRYTRYFRRGQKLREAIYCQRWRLVPVAVLEINKNSSLAGEYLVQLAVVRKLKEKFWPLISNIKSLFLVSFEVVCEFSNVYIV